MEKFKKVARIILGTYIVITDVCMILSTIFGADAVADAVIGGIKKVSKTAKEYVFKIGGWSRQKVTFAGSHMKISDELAERIHNAERISMDDLIKYCEGEPEEPDDWFSYRNE